MTSKIISFSSLRVWSPVAGGGQIQCRSVRCLPSAASEYGPLKILKIHSFHLFTFTMWRQMMKNMQSQSWQVYISVHIRIEDGSLNLFVISVYRVQRPSPLWKHCCPCVPGSRPPSPFFSSPPASLSAASSPQQHEPQDLGGPTSQRSTWPLLSPLSHWSLVWFLQ